MDEMNQAQREAVLSAVTRNYYQRYGRQPDAGAVESLVQQFMSGNRGKPRPVEATVFVDELSRDYEDPRLSQPQRDRLFHGYRGPGWTPEEFADLSPRERKYRLAPGELYQRRRNQDVRLLGAFLGSDPQEQRPPIPYHYGMGASGPLPQRAARERAVEDWRNSEGATWRTGDPNILSPRNLQWFGGNFPEDDTIRQMAATAAAIPDAASSGQVLGATAGSFMEPVERSDNAVGNLFRMIDPTYYGLKSWWQDEADFGQAMSDGFRRARAAAGISRTSPVLQGSTPSERIKELRSLQQAMRHIEPLDPGKSHYLHTGKPWLGIQSLGMDSIYNLGDLSALATVWLGGLVGAARGAAKSGVRGLGRGALIGGMAGAGNEAKSEALENLYFQGPSALVWGDRLFKPDYGTDQERLPTTDQYGKPIVETPMQRQQLLMEAQVQRENARRKLQEYPDLPPSKQFGVGGLNVLPALR